MRLIYLSSVPWASYAQRPHHMVRCFLEGGGEAAWWLDPYPTRLPALRDLRRGGAESGAASPRPNRLSVHGVWALPVEPLPGGAWFNRAALWPRLLARLRRFAASAEVLIGIGRPSALALAALEALPGRASFFDAMDDFPEFYDGRSRRTLARTEQQVAARVDRVFAASAALCEKFRHSGRTPVLLANGCDARAMPSPPARAPRAPVLGYVGTLARWFDWQTTTALAHALPQAELRLIGPCFDRPARLPANVRLLGELPHDQALAQMADFSAGLIPFLRTRLTAAVDPIKYYEYRALGLPILSTRFGEMQRRGPDDGVFFLDGGRSPEALWAEASALRRDGAGIEDFRRRNDWARRFADVGLFPAGRLRE